MYLKISVLGQKVNFQQKKHPIRTAQAEARRAMRMGVLRSLVQAGIARNLRILRRHPRDDLVRCQVHEQHDVACRDRGALPPVQATVQSCVLVIGHVVDLKCLV